MPIYQIDCQTANQWLTSGEAVLVDVREQSEYDEAHIEKARLLPLSTVTLNEAHMPEHRHKKLIIHCRSGKRSMMACETLQAEAPEHELYNMEGGILAWQAAGLPTLSATTPPTAFVLDRQGQLLLGLVLLLTTLFTQTVMPSLSFIPVTLMALVILDAMAGKGLVARLLSRHAESKKD